MMADDQEHVGYYSEADIEKLRQLGYDIKYMD